MEAVSMFWHFSYKSMPSILIKSISKVTFEINQGTNIALIKI